MDYKYKVSVILPIYNVGEHLKDCLDSIAIQSMNQNEIEVIMVNDGSTDNSIDIIRDYENIFNNAVCIDKKNAGVSEARNDGIRAAKGKYLFFLDADDAISPNCLEKLVEFFDEHYDDVEIVTPYIKNYMDGVLQKKHVRYNYLKNTGVYDLLLEPYALMTNIFFLVKNKFENNYLFKKGLAFQEDQEYIVRILESCHKIGFVKEAEYLYLRRGDGAATVLSNPIDSFEKTMEFFEYAFAKDNVPVYYQTMFFHDIQWKFENNCLYPYHYSDEKLEEARRRVKKLLLKVDCSVITKCKSIDNYQKLYWLRQRNYNNNTALISKDGIRIYYNELEIWHRENVELVINRFVIHNSKVHLFAFFKSPAFSYTDDIKFYVFKNGKKTLLDLKVGCNSYYKAREKTENFYALQLEETINQDLEIQFSVEIDGIELPVAYYLNTHSGFNVNGNNRNKIASNGISIEVNKGTIYCKKVSKADELAIIVNNSEGCTPSVKALREKMALKPESRIWLYADNANEIEGNGWIQFESDFERSDGIDRYYIVFDKTRNYEKKYESHLVSFGSMKHKLLVLYGEKIFTSYMEWQAFFPFTQDEFIQLTDILNDEIIYLQHGVMHAHIPWYYNQISLWVDKIVCSTNMEMENLVEKYNFRKEDVLPFGMPRLERLKTDVRMKKKILFAPSWRSYLVGKIVKADEARVGDVDKLLNSNYYQNLSKFIGSKKLQTILKKYGYEIDIKLHPLFYKSFGNDVFNISKSAKIKMINEDVDLNEYSLFITDYSSFLYDFLFLRRQVMYFLPDRDEFKCGLNQYRELSIPLEKAFGPYSDDVDTALSQLEEILQKKCKVDEKLLERINNLFIECCDSPEKIYNYFINED